MSIFYRIANDQIIISGDTYHHRQKIKNLGARFNGSDKTWRLNNNIKTKNQVHKLCESLQKNNTSNNDYEKKANTAYEYQIDTSDDFLSKSTKSPSFSSYLQANKYFCDQPLTSESDESEIEPKQSLALYNIDDSLDIKKTDSDNLSNDFLHNSITSSHLNEKPDKVYSVLEIGQLIKDHIENKFDKSFWIIGEIQDLRSSNKAWYFSLAHSQQDSSSLLKPKTRSNIQNITIKAIIWLNVYQRLQEIYQKDTLDNLFKSSGIRLKLRAKINYYLNQSSISLIVNDIDPLFTKGEIALRRQAIIDHLIKLGIFENNKNLKLNPFVRKIGLITGDNSRAYSDFIHQLSTANYGFKIIFTPCVMQGKQTSQSVIKCLDTLNNLCCDVIVITRGGGSEADLSWFNDLEMSKKILSLKIPVIAAIGHHEDQCIVQDIANHHLKTPTAIADYLIDLVRKSLDNLSDLQHKLLDITQNFHSHQTEILKNLTLKINLVSLNAINLHSDKLKQIAYSLEKSSIQRINFASNQLTKIKTDIDFTNQKYLTKMTNYQSDLGYKLANCINSYIHEKEINLSELKNKFLTVDPSTWIEAGWTKIISHNKKVISINNVNIDQKIQMSLIDGSISAVVTEIKPNKS